MFFADKKTHRKRHLFRKLVILLIIAAAAGTFLSVNWYRTSIEPVDSSSNSKQVTFTVNKGDSMDIIAIDLEKGGLIKNARAFKIYLRIHQEATKMQAGSYTLNSHMGVPKIATILVSGYVSKDYVTILPGKTIEQIKQSFKQAGYTNDEIEVAFNPATYADEPLLSNLPAGNSLEGLLYPNTYQREAATPATTIVRNSLEEMQTLVAPDIKAGFAAHGLTVYQGLTMASIVYQESGESSYQPIVAQVFILRIKQGMALGSDVTAFYAADLVGAGKTLGVDSPYNTRIHTGIPPGPISSFTDNALKAVAHPSNTDYLFFVAGDDGVLHFTRTVAEHEQATKQYCTKECS